MCDKINKKILLNLIKDYIRDEPIENALCSTLITNKEIKSETDINIYSIIEPVLNKLK